MPTVKSIIVAMTFAALSACKPQKVPDEIAARTVLPPLTEDQAHDAFEATKAAWVSMDATRNKALYDKGIIGFNAVGPLISDSETWNANQDSYGAAKIDKIKVLSKKVQLLAPDVFVISSLSRVSSTAAPRNGGILRCTDVYRRKQDGRVLIVNEHCSKGTMR